MSVTAQAQCKKCPEKSGRGTSAEGVAWAMRHGEEVHGNRYLGVRWSFAREAAPARPPRGRTR